MSVFTRRRGNWRLTDKALQALLGGAFAGLSQILSVRTGGLCRRHAVVADAAARTDGGLGVGATPARRDRGGDAALVHGRLPLLRPDRRSRWSSRPCAIWRCSSGLARPSGHPAPRCSSAAAPDPAHARDDLRADAAPRRQRDLRAGAAAEIVDDADAGFLPRWSWRSANC